MLANLNEVVKQARENLEQNFSGNEIVFSDEFKLAFQNASVKQNILFLPHTAVVETADNLKMYIPNQWFIIAAYTVDVIKHLEEYRRITTPIIKSIQGSQEGKIKWKNAAAFCEALRNNNTEAVSMFVEELDRHYTSDQEIDNTRDFIIKFATDYAWWSGHKTIERNDCYVSPTLSILGVVNTSQGFIAEISKLYATNHELALAVQTSINKEIDSKPLLSPSGVTCVENNRLKGGINEIVCGAPGTGKSRYLQEKYGFSTECTRVVFHPEYTSFDFVGNYKPVTLYRETSARITTLSGELFEMGEPMVDYKYVPGPFITTLAAAWKNPDKMYTLIIEEINRANAAAVFAEIFQLLDRDSSGTSIYSIKPSEELQQYLFSFGELRQYLQDGLRIPSNLNIVATMNSADQGVIPMDSAFKRRWSFKYMRISIDNAIHSTSIIKYASRDISWGEFIKAVNKKLMGLGVDEDRLIGPYFITPEELGNNSAINKLLLYLWDDVLRHNRGEFFNNQIQTYADLSECFSLKDVLSIDNEP